MIRRFTPPARAVAATVLTFGLATAVAIPASAAKPSSGFLTPQAPFITLDPGLPSGASVKAIISSGDTLGDFVFEGIPDGIGLRPGPSRGTVDVYVAHEQSTVPFRNARDFVDSSVSRLTLTTRGGRNQGSVVDASVALSPDEGFLRFCSASMFGPDEGLDDYVFFTGEETNDIVEGVQRGFAVVLNTDTGENTAVPGMGRLNHENTVIVPGGWGDDDSDGHHGRRGHERDDDRRGRGHDDDGPLVMLTTDDTFNAPSSQLYMYMADDQDAIFDDTGTLYAFRVTGVDGVPLEDPENPMNGANDYLDLGVGMSFQGEFIPVPEDIAKGDQTALENWSNDNNVYQSIRLEDLTTDANDPRVVYIADTGALEVVPDDATGRLKRERGGVGQADHGRVLKLVMNADDPTVVDSLTILADGDAVGTDVYVPFTSPDNVGVSTKSLMVQEDRNGAVIWQYRFNQESWRVVASVNDPLGESSGIVDASEWFGKGTWLLDVQAHGTNVTTDTGTEPGTLIKRESGQLMLVKIPGS